MEEEQYYSTLQEINEIYQILAHGEPSPDDEIEAREKLISKFGILKGLNIIPRNDILIDETLNKLENWDTLDLWFKEVDDLSENIEEILKEIEKTEVAPKEHEVVKDKEKPVELKEVEKSTQIVVNDIVAQVSEQFKGEIDGLKDTIEKLKGDLEKKDASLKEIFKIKAAQRITPKRDIKLPPPEIKIPVIIKPPKPQPPQPQSEKLETPLSEEFSSPPPIAAQIEEELKISKIEKLEKDEKISKFVPLTPLTPEKEPTPIVTQEEISIEPEDFITLSELPKLETIPSEMPEVDEKPKISPLSHEKLKPIPKIPKVQEIPKVSFEVKKITSKDIESPRIPPEIIEKIKDVPEVSDIPELPSKPPKKPKITTLVQEVPKFTPQISDALEEKPAISEKQKVPTVMEEVPPLIPETLEKKTFLNSALKKPIDSKPSAKPKFTPFIKGKPKITQVKVEELETEAIKSSSSDLFNVFSTFGAKTQKEAEQPKESFDSLLTKRKKKKEETEIDAKEKFTPFRPVPKFVSKIAESDTSSSEEITTISEVNEISDSIEELPTDKDSLYQELIALEGRRYSLERQYKDVEDRYQKGSIGDSEYKKKNKEIKNQLTNLTNKINKIRRIIATI